MTKPMKMTKPLKNLAKIIALASDQGHHFSKPLKKSMTLVKGLGVKGDAHYGRTVQHLSRIKKNPHALNLRQVHLIHGELLIELAGRGFEVQPGQMGENITTFGIDLLSLSQGTQLGLGPDALIEITGLRNPCAQLNTFAPGLMQAVLDKDEKGNLVRKSGVMAIVIKGGDIHPGDDITVQFPPAPHISLGPV